MSSQSIPGWPWIIALISAQILALNPPFFADATHELDVDIIKRDQADDLEIAPYIDIKELIELLWSERWIFIFFSTVFAALSIVYSLSQPNVYVSTALLGSRAGTSVINQLSSPYGSLAQLAEFALPVSDEQSERSEAVALLTSKSFFVENLYEPLAIPLMAVQEWNRATGELILDEEVYDSTKRVWVRKVPHPFKPKPHPDEVFEFYVEALDISVDNRTGFVTLSFSHQSPIAASQILNLIIDTVNAEIGKEKIREAKLAITYLNEQSSKTPFVKLDETISKLIEEQMKVIMLAEINNDYVFKKIQEPNVALLKSSPNRAVICIVGTLLGFIASSLVVIFLTVRIGDKSAKQRFQAIPIFSRIA